MADRYVQIQNFKWGLETRKSELITQAGALKSIVNGFINAGGEIEQRKSFARSTTLFPPNTFGLEATSAGLVTFGSRITANQVSITSTYRTTNVANITTARAHGLSVGMLVNIVGVTSHAELNGTGQAVTAVDSATDFKIASVGADYTAAAEAVGYMNQSLPSGVTYQRLQGPETIPTATVIGTELAEMTGVIFSCNFNGKAFVIASFANLTGYYCFYDGYAIGQTVFGRVEVVYTQALNYLAQFLALNVNDVAGWIAHANVGAIGPSNSTGYREIAQNGSVLVMSPPGVHFTPTITEDSTNGVLAAYLVDQNYAGIVGKAAFASFAITGGSAGGTILLEAPLNSDGTGSIQLTDGTVTWNTSASLTATDVVNEVNGRTYLTGYSATANGSNITVFAPLSWGAVTFNLTVTTNNITTGVGGTGTISVDLSTYSVYVIKNQPRGGATVQGSCTATVSGSTGTLTFLWQPCNPDGSTTGSPTYSINLINPTGPIATFSHSFITQGQVEGYYLLTVTDSANPTQPISKVVSVHLELSYTL